MKCHTICHNILLYVYDLQTSFIFNVCCSDRVNNKRSTNSSARSVCVTKLKLQLFAIVINGIHCTQYIISFYVLIIEKKKIDHVKYVDSAHASNVHHENAFLSTVVVRAIGKCLMSRVNLALKKNSTGSEMNKIKTILIKETAYGAIHWSAYTHYIEKLKLVWIYFYDVYPIWSNFKTTFLKIIYFQLLIIVNISMFFLNFWMTLDIFYFIIWTRISFWKILIYNFTVSHKLG